MPANQATIQFCDYPTLRLPILNSCTIPKRSYFLTRIYATWTQDCL